MAKKCPNCNSKNTESMWSVGQDIYVAQPGEAFYCHNCGNAFK